MEGIETSANSNSNNPTTPPPQQQQQPPQVTAAGPAVVPLTAQQPLTAAAAAVAALAGAAGGPCANVVTIPVPIVQNEETYAYVTVKGSLHDRSCAAFGLNEAEIQALSKRFENGVKPVVNGVLVPVSPLVLLNTLAQLGYKVVCSCGEAEICWTMQREI